MSPVQPRGFTRDARYTQRASQVSAQGGWHPLPEVAHSPVQTRDPAG